MLVELHSHMLIDFVDQAAIVELSPRYRKFLCLYLRVKLYLTPNQSVCFPDFEEMKWTYNRTMERVLFKEAYRVCEFPRWKSFNY